MHLVLSLLVLSPPSVFFFFFFNDTATTEIYTLSLHDAPPISPGGVSRDSHRLPLLLGLAPGGVCPARSEEHTSELHHVRISYAVFCLKKKKINIRPRTKRTNRCPLYECVPYNRRPLGSGILAA